MNENTFPATGYLIVKVSTARGAIPLENASVSIREERENGGGILYSLTTNSDGQTPRVSLPTKPRSQSEAPGTEKPFATYSIDVFKEGYLPLYFQNVPVFDSILSIQPAVMLPAPEGEADLRFPPTVFAVEESEPYGDL